MLSAAGHLTLSTWEDGTNHYGKHLMLQLKLGIYLLGTR